MNGYAAAYLGEGQGYIVSTTLSLVKDQSQCGRHQNQEEKENKQKPDCTPPLSSRHSDSPDWRRLRSFNLQIIWLLLHLEFGEDEGDGIAWICQYGPLTLPTAAEATGSAASTTATSPRTRRVTAGEIKAGDEATGAPQGAAARVLRCQSPKTDTDMGEGERGSKHTLPLISEPWLIISMIVD